MYFFVLALLFFLTFKYEYSGHLKHNKSAYLFVYVVFALMSGLRYRLGVDSVMYEELFKDFPTIDKYVWGYEYNGDANDIFWAIFNCLCKTIWDNWVCVQIVMGFFINGVIFWFIKKYSSRPFLGVLLYFVTLWPLLTFEALREAMSVSFFIWALDGLYSGKGVRSYYVRVWPAVLFHTFGFLTLFFPLLKLIKPSKLTTFLTIVASVCVLYGGYLLSELLMPYIQLGSAVGNKLTMYFDSDDYGTNMWSIGGVLAIALGYIIPLSLMAIIVSKSKNEAIKWLFPYLIFMLLVSLFKISLPVFYRLFNYFYVVIIIAATECLNEPPSSKVFGIPSRRAVLASTVLFVAMVFVALLKPVGHTNIPAIYRYYPYNSVITKDYVPQTEKLLPY